MLIKLNRDHGYPLLVISGNHDSAVRLRTGRAWYAATKMFVNTQVAEAFTPIELDGVQFFLLPYFEPFAVRDYFQDKTITNVAQAIRPIVAKMKTLFKPDMRHILVSHFSLLEVTIVLRKRKLMLVDWTRYRWMIWQHLIMWH